MKINLIEYLENTVKEKPQRTAVIDGIKSISFNELNILSLNIAEKILDTTKAIRKPIAVYLPKSIDSVAADIAISYSGNVYMNLDIKSPATRIGNIIRLIQPEAIISNKSYAGIITSINKDVPLIVLDEIKSIDEVDNDLIYNRLANIIDTDPYCIINTSGSTGTPKGVVLNYKSFIDFIEWAIETLQISNNEIIGSLSPLIFDIYSFELCMLMAKGSTITILPDSFAPFPAKILSIMQENKVTFIFWVPTIMVNIAKMDLLSRMTLPDLKTVWFAGEVFPTMQFNYWKKFLPETKFVNLYGPIEITLDCTYYIVDREIKDDEPIPIGFPCRNTDILILNDKNEVAEINEEGELCVRGTSLAMGYYNNPEKTAAAFVQNPLNTAYPEIIYRTGDVVFINSKGEIIFKGRKDSLVKHLGYRIELMEIEHIIINTLKLVDNGCVVYNRLRKEITLFYESLKSISVSEMKSKINDVLPKYMVPTIYIQMNELPRNTNGKIDRLFLNNSVNNG